METNEGMWHKRMDGLMGETDRGTVSGAIFIAVPLNQMAAPSPADRRSTAQSFIHARVRDRDVYICVNFSMSLKWLMSCRASGACMARPHLWIICMRNSRSSPCTCKWICHQLLCETRGRFVRHRATFLILRFGFYLWMQQQESVRRKLKAIPESGDIIEW